MGSAGTPTGHRYPRTVATSRIADHVGRVLGGRYRLLAPIGTGASAHVFLADDVRLRRRVAVKVLHAALADDEAFLRRFRAEAQAAAALNHPNIMRVFDWGEDADGPYLVLEYLGGGSLRDLLDRGRRLTPSQAALVGLEAARALDYAHRRGLVHRDIKPANLLFDDEGRLCIADFGLARALAEAAWTEPTGAVLGTARYASPEQAQGSSVDGRADVYALALVLVEAVTGQVPFSADTTVGHAHGPHRAAPRGAGRAGAAGRRWSTRAGSRRPAERLDAAAFVAALDRAVARPARARPAPARRRRRPRRHPRRRPRPHVAAARHARGCSTGRRHRPRRATALPTSSPSCHAVARAGRRRRRWLIALAIVIAVLARGRRRLRRVRRPSCPSTRCRTGRSHARSSAAGRRPTRSFDVDQVAAASSATTPRPARSSARTRRRGAACKEGQAVELVVSKGPGARDVPDLTRQDRGRGGVGRSQARGFKSARSTPQFNEDAPKGLVLDWAAQGRRAAQGQPRSGSSCPTGPSRARCPTWQGKTVRRGRGGAQGRAAGRGQGRGVQRHRRRSARSCPPAPGAGRQGGARQPRSP